MIFKPLIRISDILIRIKSGLIMINLFFLELMWLADLDADQSSDTAETDWKRGRGQSMSPMGVATLTEMTANDGDAIPQFINEQVPSFQFISILITLIRSHFKSFLIDFPGMADRLHWWRWCPLPTSTSTMRCSPCPTPSSCTDSGSCR